MASESPTTTDLAYRNRLSRRLDHWLFVVVFVIGSVGIIALKESGFEQLFVTAFPVTLMIVYAIYVANTRRYLLREDQAGDNLYYLGFLYTLVSLAYSLYFFAGEEESTQKIIGNFGLALATTIIGLMARVLLNQMREDPVEIEREARVELRDAVAGLKAELDTSVLELSSFRRAIAQSLSEGLTEVSNRAKTVLTEHTVSLSELVEQAREKLNDGISFQVEIQNELNAASQKAVNAVERLAKGVESVSVPSDIIERKLSPPLEALADSARNLVTQARAQGDNIDKFNSLIEGTVETFRLLDERLAAFAEEAERRRRSLASEIDQLRAHKSAGRWWWDWTRH